MNHVIHLVAAKCGESRGLIHLKKQIEIKRLEQKPNKNNQETTPEDLAGKNEKRD